MILFRVLCYGLLALNSFLCWRYSEAIARGLAQAQDLRVNLLVSPKDTLRGQCSPSGAPLPSSCPVVWHWHGADGWESPCTSLPLPPVIGPRYWKINVHCTVKMPFIQAFYLNFEQTFYR